jgi:hypothetical protein
MKVWKPTQTHRSPAPLGGRQCSNSGRSRRALSTARNGQKVHLPAMPGASQIGKLLSFHMLPAGAIAGWVYHPLENAPFARRMPAADLQPPNYEQQLRANRPLAPHQMTVCSRLWKYAIHNACVTLPANREIPRKHLLLNSAFSGKY